MGNEELKELEKWRLMLGGDKADGTDISLPQLLEGMDEALTALYEYKSGDNFGDNYDSLDKKGGSEKSILLSQDG